MNNMEINHHDLAAAVQLHDKGIEQLDNLILEERRAKLMTVAGLVVGDNVLYVGNPGGGKSTLTADLYRLVSGIEADDVADVPHRSDLTGAQLVGDTIDAVKRTTDTAGNETIERIGTDVLAIINQDSKIIRFDEINRVNPYTVNAALDVLANRKIKVGGKDVPLKNLEMVIAAMNPGESRQATFRMADALVSRQAMGVVLGSNQTLAERERIANRIWGGWESTPEAMSAAITLDGLHGVRRAAKRVIVSDEARNAGSHVGLQIANEMTSRRIPEADGRINLQLSQSAKALALLRGRTTVNLEDINDAANFLITARLSAVGKPMEEIQPVIDKIAA